MAGWRWRRRLALAAIHRPSESNLTGVAAIRLWHPAADSAGNQWPAAWRNIQWLASSKYRPGVWRGVFCCGVIGVMAG